MIDKLSDLVNSKHYSVAERIDRCSINIFVFFILIRGPRLQVEYIVKNNDFSIYTALIQYI